MNHEWWRDFFNGLAVDLWLGFEPQLPTAADAEFIQAALAAPAGGRMLDVPCGGGRHSLALAQRGFRVTGVDFSERFLNTARSRAADAELKIAWEQRDMRDLPWPDTFDGALCFGNSFGYLDDEGNAGFLQAVARVLKPGARFVIDTGVMAESVLPHLESRGWHLAGGVHMLIENRYDAESGRLYTDYTFVRGAQIEKRSGFHRIYTLNEFRRLLQQAGFARCEACSSTRRDAFKLGDRRLLMIATRG